MDADFSDPTELAPVVDHTLKQDTPGVAFVLFFMLTAALVVLLAIMQ